MKTGDLAFAFFFPRITRTYIVRLLLVAVSAVVIFRFVLIPYRVEGYSMVPTYQDGEFNFCFSLRYAFDTPAPSDIVLIRMAGSRVMLLKRVVATEGQTVSFSDGQLYVDLSPVAEPYVSRTRPWNLPPRTVKKGHVYVVGDNRDVAMERHDFGQTPIDRVAGVPLW